MKSFEEAKDSVSSDKSQIDLKFEQLLSQTSLLDKQN